jgi:hypothetical protein
MARGRTTKSTKKFESKHLSRTIENRKIQRKNKEKYDKRNPGHDARKSGARAIATSRKKLPRKLLLARAH